MDDLHAQSLQNQAIEALSKLRAWIWARQPSLLPDDVSRVTRGQAQRYSAYLDWYTTVEEALQALSAAAPSFGEPHAELELAVASTKRAAVPGPDSVAVAVDRPSEPPLEKPVSKPVEQAAEAPAPPTLRVTAPRPSSRSGVWYRTIAVSELSSERVSSRKSAA